MGQNADIAEGEPETNHEALVEKIRSLTVNGWLADAGAPCLQELAKSSPWLQEIGGSAMYCARLCSRIPEVWDQAAGLLDTMDALLKDLPLDKGYRTDYRSLAFARFVGAVQAFVTIGNKHPKIVADALRFKIESQLESASRFLQPK